MQAIRQSPDPMRTMDAFWSGQLKSKEWLIDNLKPYIDKGVTIDIHGGWVGVLASMLFQTNIVCKKIRSVDVDPTCQGIAVIMNKGEEMSGRFEAITANMCEITSAADVIINTSCEHISQDQYDLWLKGVPTSSLIVLQSNNYNIPEHIRISNDLEEFKSQSNLKILWSGELELPLYKRFMIIGYKDV
jgi:hypothetical protein